ncbi:MAG: chemotaxis protein CheW [Motiliproteus sp.]|nr:chemotaxis protein CheW [Motiliproteus sp.]MCW9051741.1 chemotaxis protein CheW [Motiliproteus sp.]
MSSQRRKESSQPQLVATQTPAPQRAVQEYLDALLQDATAQAIAEPVSTTTVVETVPEVEDKVEMAEASPVVTPVVAPIEEVVEAPVAEPAQPLVKSAEVQEIALDQAETEQLRAWKEGRPGWAQEAFECLLFKVAGLTLAVPLVELGGVLTMEDDLNPLFGQPEWFLGLLPSKTAGTVKTIDTARWVMPEKYTEETRQGLKYVILMEGTDWGMACHEVAEAITLQPDQVRWRGERSQRPWLAGTVIEHMCAIMDVSALVDLLSEDSLKIKAPQWTRHYPSAT